MATFITTKPVGSTINIFIGVTGGYFRIKRGDVIGPVTQSGNVSFTINEPIGDPSREFTIILVSAGGGQVPKIQTLSLDNCGVSQFDGDGLIFTNTSNNNGTLTLSNNPLTTFNGTGITDLCRLYLQGCVQLNTFNGTGLSSLNLITLDGCTGLNTFIAGGNMPLIKNLSFGQWGVRLTTFDGNGLSGLESLYLFNSYLTSFDTTGLSSLKMLYLDNNQLTSFDGTGLSSLNWLHLQSNQLTTFVGTGLTNLKGLVLMGNQLTSFDGTGLSSIENLHLYGNQLTSFVGTGLSSLNNLVLQNNQLTSFDGTGLTNLSQLHLQNNQLTSFDGTGLPNLQSLYLTDNQLTSFDATGITNLIALLLQNNQLTSFVGTGLPNLDALFLQNNQLTSFDGNGLNNIRNLFLQNNQLTSFDGTGLTLLQSLDLTDNQLTSFDGTDLLSLNNLQGFDSSNITSFIVNDSLLQLFINLLPSVPNFGSEKNKYDGLEQIKNEVKSTFEQRINAKSNIIKNLTKLKLLLSRIEEKPTDVGTINAYYDLLVETTDVFNNAAPLYFTTELYLWKETLQNEKSLWDSMEGHNVNYGQAYYDFIINILNSNYVNEFGVGYELYNNLKAAWNTLSVECYRLISNRGYTTPNQEFISRMQESIRQAYGSAINKYAYFKLASDLSNGPWKAEAGVSEQYINLLKSATSNQEKIDEIDAKANSVINFFDNQSSYLSYKATLLSQFLTDFENVVIQMSYDTDALHTHAKEKGVKSIHPLKFVLTLIKFQVLNNIGDEPNSRTMGIFKELVDNGSWTVEQVNDFYGWLSSNISKFNTIAEGALNALANRQYSVPNTWSIVNNMDYRNSIAKFVLVEKEIEYYNELLSQYPTAILSLQNEISGMESEIYTLEIEKSELEVNNDTENPRYTEVNGLISGLISDIQERNGIIAEKEVLITVETQLRDMLISDSSWYNNFKVTLNSILNSTALNMYDDLYDILTEFDGKTMPQYFNLDGIV